MEWKGGVSKAMLCGLAASLFLGALATPAAAQFSDSYNFLKAVREADGDTATKLLAKPGAPVLNTRDPSNGETALHIVVRQHNDNWVAFLLSKGAIVDLRDRDGNTPMHTAALFGDTTAIAYLLAKNAKIDVANNSGETPLILAVHRRDPATVQLLIDEGADPKIPDTIAGKSALDYATDDPRGAAMVKIMGTAKPKPAKVISGPVR